MGRSLAEYASRLACDWDRRAAGADRLLLRGSLLKVDISGFTRLSERLALASRTGAEEVNAVLDQVFSDLIEPVLERGGDVLQFGGDALAIWFDGDQHEQRTAAAAALMHDVIRRRPAEQTPAGSVRLRMSAGAAAGEFLFAVTGTDHRELVVLGPSVGEVMQLESAADPGQTLVGSTLAAALPAGAVRAGPGGALLRPAAGRLAVPVRSTRPGTAMAGDFLAPDVRAVLRAGIPAGEHRRVAVSFIRLSGLDALRARRGPGEVVRRVHRLTAVVEEAIAGTGVCWTATDLTGDGVIYLLYAGAPTTREDDAERMLRACRTVVERTRGLPVQVGASTGRAFAGVMGHPRRRAYAVLGDCTNLAARLMSVAAPGTALVAKPLWERSDRTHRMQWLPPMTARGRRQQTEPGLLGSREALGPAPTRREDRTPIIGREAELARLLPLATGSGTASPALMVGEPGVGKSTLCSEVVARARSGGVQVLMVRGAELDREASYAAVRAELRRLLMLPSSLTAAAARVRNLAGEEAELVGLLGLPLGLPLPVSPAMSSIDPRFVSARRDELLIRVLRAAVPGPLLVLAEDLHLLDAASQGWLRALGGTEPGVRPALLVTSRPTLPAGWPPERWSRLDLPALDHEEGRRLALLVAGEDDPRTDDELDRLVAEAGGNPLFLGELVRWTRTADTSEALPESAEQVIAARFDTLEPRLRAAIRECSVAGAAVDLTLMSEVLQDPSIARHDRWAAAGEFVSVEGGRLSFRHDLYRQTAYLGLAVRRRKAVHGALADRLLEVADPERAALSLHLAEAGRFAEAAEMATEAADVARRAGALADSIDLYRRAVGNARSAGWPEWQVSRVEVRLADAAELLGRYDVADQAYRSAARAAAPEDVPTLLIGRATAVERQGRYRQALSLLTRAEHARPSAAALRSLRLRRASVLHRLGRLRPSLAEAAAVESAARRAHDRADRARALLRMEMVASELGLPERFELGRKALEAFHGLDEHRDFASLLGNLGVTAWEADDWELAMSHQSAAAETYRLAGDVVGRAFAVNNAAEILCDQGWSERAAEGFTDARRTFRAAGHLFGVACTASSLGRLAARRRDVPQARRYLDEAITDFERSGMKSFAVDARARHVELALLTWDPEASGRADSVRTELDHLEVGVVLPATVRRYQGIAELQRGREDTGRALLAEALELARGARALYEEYLCLDALVGLDALRGHPIDDTQRSRRDEIAVRLGIVDTPTYPPLLAVPGPGRPA